MRVPDFYVTAHELGHARSKLDVEALRPAAA
jgi:hypothetical protein